MQALLLHFRKDGKKVIEKVARNQPAAYIKIWALLIPKEMKIEHFSTVKDLTDEEHNQKLSMGENSHEDLRNRYCSHRDRVGCCPS